ncbi:hypothetical protein [Ktedonobacter sp. SOSP1-52]|uniref:hypothetical protein n=1 Tax=Ktedonobacter sp. SOSP1-52 TaxID=2778366 RepID=UPI001915679E|nr:hypothetical protein [Ktedonobacter sp. SOSP1-52]
MAPTVDACRRVPLGERDEADGILFTSSRLCRSRWQSACSRRASRWERQRDYYEYHLKARDNIRGDVRGSRGLTWNQAIHMLPPKYEETLGSI